VESWQTALSPAALHWVIIVPKEVDYSVYMIDPGDWECATGQSVDRSVMVRVLPGEYSRCEWTYNDECDRWDTECEDIAVDQNDETPKDFGFKFCPYCGKLISWNG
jgi:hypothetical protein